MPDAKYSDPNRTTAAEPARILLLVTQADWGGVQSFLSRFASNLKSDGHEVLLAAGGDGELWRNASTAGVCMHQLRNLVRDISLIKDIQAFREIRRLIDSFKPDAIHLNSSKMGVLGSLAARFSRTKPRVIYRIGGWVFLEPISSWKKWLYRTAEKTTARFKDVIITVHPGDELLAETIGIKPRERILTVPNGLDYPRFTDQLLSQSDARSALGLPPSAFVYGTVANAYATKGLIPYLDVAKKIMDENPDVWFVILGDGPEFGGLKHKCDSLGLDRLILTGHRDDADRLYRAFDIFVLPSRKEGMPWTVLEAMASGIPVVASDVGACRWMLNADADRPAGLVVPPNDPETLRHSLRSLYQDPDLRGRLGASGSDIVRQNFTWPNTYKGNRDTLLKRAR
ncbi:glycosyltransferase family 4 protein [Candidatus Uhrbacteria bacterium]|nr:glycosyltransferase family 4 protein [Candidatus Uhrbacteria bacterium]